MKLLSLAAFACCVAAPAARAAAGIPVEWVRWSGDPAMKDRPAFEFRAWLYHLQERVGLSDNTVELVELERRQPPPAPDIVVNKDAEGIATVARELAADASELNAYLRMLEDAAQDGGRLNPLDVTLAANVLALQGSGAQTPAASEFASFCAAHGIQAGSQFGSVRKNKGGFTPKTGDAAYDPRSGLWERYAGPEKGWVPL